MRAFGVIFLVALVALVFGGCSSPSRVPSGSAAELEPAQNRFGSSVVTLIATKPSYAPAGESQRAPAQLGFPRAAANGGPYSRQARNAEAGM
jgi:hypothetical protein